MTSYAIVPAAGRSRRMGSPKLLLPWGEGTLIERVLAAWRASRVDRVLVVVHADDHELAARCRGERTTVITPATPPPEMKDSVAAALQRIEHDWTPGPADCWLLAPADIPTLSPLTIDRLLAAHERSQADGRIDNPSYVSSPPILVPAHSGRRGHPVLFPWALAAEVFLLRADEGVNQLLRRHGATEVPCPVEELGDDIDTPEDYHRLTQP